MIAGGIVGGMLGEEITLSSLRTQRALRREE
jgi:hypothetical protein